MKRNTQVVLAVTLSVLFGAVSLLAHHSAAAAYEIGKKVTLKGTVTKLDWKNPHIFY